MSSELGFRQRFKKPRRESRSPVNISYFMNLLLRTKWAKREDLAQILEIFFKILVLHYILFPYNLEHIGK